MLVLSATGDPVAFVNRLSVAMVNSSVGSGLWLSCFGGIEPACSVDGPLECLAFSFE
jgi:hypothetical protein